MSPLSIYTVNCSLSGAFEALGYGVTAVLPKPGFFDVAADLKAKNLTPDVLIQQETLGQRVLLRGLEEVPCLKFFWSIDTHLNSFWQIYYGRLFDAVGTTQKHWVKRLQALGLKRVFWLPWYGEMVESRPWKDRCHQFSFVGRITPQRPTRKWFIEFLLKEAGLHLVQDVPFQQMQAVYTDTKVAPNEAISGEVNFRTFEAASCGCAVLNQEVEDGLSDLFVPNDEILTFAHALELKEKLAFLLSHDAETRRIAAAGRARVLKDHLVEHRARALLSAIQTMSSQHMSSLQAVKNWWLAALALWQADRCELNSNKVEELFLKLPADPETITALLNLRCTHPERDLVTALLTPMLVCGQYAHDLGLNVAASGAAWRIQDFGLARQFYYRFMKEHGRKAGRVENFQQLFLLWATELEQAGRIFRPGFVFDPKRHLPETAFECLLLAEAGGQIEGLDDSAVYKRLDALIRGIKGLEPLRLSVLSRLSLLEPDNWRIGAELGCVDLSVFRLQEALEELILARDLAHDKCQAKAFQNFIRRRDPGGSISRVLGFGKEGEAGDA